MKNAAKNKNTTIHIPKEDVSYNHGIVFAKIPQSTQELSAKTVHICIFSLLHSRIKRNILTIHTKYGTKQYKIICPISSHEF